MSKKSNKNAKPSKGPSKIQSLIKKRLPTISALSVRNDVLINPGLEAPLAIARFSSFFEWTLKDGIMLLTPAQLVIATVVTCEGLATASDLTSCLNALASAVRRGTEVHASWEPDGVLRRISLSSVTLIAIHLLEAKNEGAVDWTLELHQFSDTLSSFYPGAKNLRAVDRIRAVMADASAWLFLNLPMVCFAYVSGNLKLALLSEATLDRQIGVYPEKTDDDKTLALKNNLAPAKDAALDLAFDKLATASKSQWIIEALKRVVSVSEGQDGVRVADFLARDEVRLRMEAVSSSLVRIGTPIDALLLCWVLYLLEVGSARLKNPKISTIERYVRVAVARLHHALNACNTSPVDMSQDQWEKMFNLILDGDDVSKELRNSLASFHCFLVSTVGIDPLPRLHKDVDEVFSVSANVVWLEEVERTKSLLMSVPDERMRQAMLVMLAIGTKGKVRIGEVRSLRLCNIREVGEELLIEIAPARAHHQGKSAVARRVFCLKDPEDARTIKKWVERREQESAGVGDLLFGDPHDPRKCYRIGACQRILNQALKDASGDPDVSYHSLRHTVFSVEILEALMTADLHHPISPMHITTVEGGHQHCSTTQSIYFHRPEAPIRRWVDRKIDEHLDSPVLAAKWTGKSADSLRQGRQRAAKKGQYLPELLKKHTLAFYKEAIRISPPLSEFQETAIQPKSISIDTVVKILSDVNEQYALPAVCSRSSIDEKEVAQLSRAVASVARKLDQHAGRRHAGLSVNANTDACFKHAGVSLRELEFAFDFNREPLVANLAAQAEKGIESADVVNAADAWTEVMEGGVLSFQESDAIRPLIMFMHKSISADHLVIRTEVSDIADKKTVDDALDSAEMTDAQAIVEEIYQASVQTEGVKPRRGRPRTYLMISRARTGTGKASAAASCRMQYFHGLMFALAVWNQYYKFSMLGSANGN